MGALYKRIPLWLKILSGLVLGIIFGAIFKQDALILQPLGDIFVNAIKMLIVPLVLSSLIVGVTSMDNLKKIGRIGLKTIITYLVTTVIAIGLGLGLSLFLNLGKGVEVSSSLVHTENIKTASITLTSLIPTNPVQAIADGDILQIIIFALFFGIAINIAGEKAKPVKDFFVGLAEVMYKMTAVVMEFAPYGVFALIACVVGREGIGFLLPLIKVIVVVYVVCLLHMIFVLGGCLSLFKLNPVRFFKGFIEAIVLSYSMSSSSGALPVSMKAAQEKLGVTEGISSFVLSLGATINMNGTAIYQGVCAIFIANAYGIHLEPATYVTIMLTSVLAAIGTAGIPGAGLIMLSLVLKSAGLPLEGIALVAGIDRILDMARSCVNVVGDGVATVIIAKTEKEIDLDVYNSVN